MASFSLDSTVHITTASSPRPKLHQSPTAVIHISVPSAVSTASTISTNYSARSQWLRASVLGANDGLVSIASLIIGVSAINQSPRAMLISGFAGLVAGACSMAIGEFVSVYTQYDIEVAHRKRQNIIPENDENESELPSPGKAAAASALAFSLGAILPLLAGCFIKLWWIRLAVVAGVSSVGLLAFGVAGAVLGGAAVGKAAARVLVGGWIAMFVTYGVVRLFGLAFKMDISSAT